MNYHSITLRLMNYIQTHGHEIDDWCMGVTNNIEMGLYKNHKVNPSFKNDFQDAKTVEAAQEVIKQLNSEFSIINVTVPEDENGTIVFVYKRTPYTNEF